MFRKISDSAEGRHIRDGDVGKHFSIQLYAGPFQTMDESLIGKSLNACCRIDAGDPEVSESSLLDPTISIGIAEPLLESLTRGAIEPAPAPYVALSQL